MRWGPIMSSLRPSPGALAELTTTEVREALRDRKAVLGKKQGLPADMCRHAIERLEAELERRAGNV